MFVTIFIFKEVIKFVEHENEKYLKPKVKNNNKKKITMLDKLVYHYHHHHFIKSRRNGIIFH